MPLEIEAEILLPAHLGLHCVTVSVVVSWNEKILAFRNGLRELPVDARLRKTALKPGSMLLWESPHNVSGGTALVRGGE